MVVSTNPVGSGIEGRTWLGKHVSVGEMLNKCLAISNE